MNNWFICWFFTHILLGIFIFKGLTARRLYKSFGFKGLSTTYFWKHGALFLAFVWTGTECPGGKAGKLA
jgi:hypothetical protein